MNKTTFVDLRGVWYAIAAVLIGLSAAFLGMWGLKQGIEFTGGTLMAVQYAQTRPSNADLQRVLDESGIDLGAVVIQPAGDRDVQFRLRNLSDEEHVKLFEALKKHDENVQELRYDAIGPTIGNELRQKSLTGLIIVLLAILAYVAFVFRGVSAPIQSWKYGLVTIFASGFTVLIPLGLYAFLGKFHGVEIGTPFVAAIMTIIGYSMTDTIVVMDRIRENLRKMSASYPQIVEQSIRQTFVRSMTNSMATLLTLFAIFFYGGDTLDEFTLPLILGIIIGTFSSMLIASPLLVTLNNWKNKK